MYGLRRILINTVSFILYVSAFIWGPVFRIFSRAYPNNSLWVGSIISIPVNAKAESLLGCNADTLAFKTYHITNQFKYNLSKWTKGPLNLIVPFFVFFWACLKYRRFHFFCDRGILPQTGRHCFNPFELKILKLLKKEVFLWTYGADIRTRRKTESLGKYNCCMDCPSPGTFCICDDSKWEKNYSYLKKYSTAIFSMGDMTEYCPGSDKELFFWPLDLANPAYSPAYPEDDPKKSLRIVHAPNHRHFKGTRFLIDAVESLKKDGCDIDLIMVEKIPNEQALNIYRTADIIFDQCIVGFHGYFANEAMAMGKPVMCFIRKPEEYLLHAAENPIINISADNIAETINKFYSNRVELNKIGKAGRLYIENHYTVGEFSKRLALEYSKHNIIS